MDSAHCLALQAVSGMGDGRNRIKSREKALKLWVAGEWVAGKWVAGEWVDEVDEEWVDEEWVAGEWVTGQWVAEEWAKQFERSIYMISAI